MKSALKLGPKLALAAGLAVSLGFGIKEAAACTTCEEPPPTSCTQYADPDLFCRNLCINFYGCVDGACVPAEGGCICPLR